MLHNGIFSYKTNLNEAIFSAIEMCKQPYTDIMNMPVKRLYDLLKWKADIEEEKSKIMKDQKLKSMSESKKKR